MESEGEDNPDIYITRSGRKSKAPERLQYDVHLCLIRSNDMNRKRDGVNNTS
jgi:hypothetical protein